MLHPARDHTPSPVATRVAAAVACAALLGGCGPGTRSDDPLRTGSPTATGTPTTGIAPGTPTGTSTSTTSTTLAPGCYALWRQRNTANNHWIIRLPDQQGDPVTYLWELDGSHEAFMSSAPKGLAWFDGAFWTRGPQDDLHRYRLATDSFGITPTLARSFAVHEGQMLVDPTVSLFDTWRRYASAEAIGQDTHTETGTYPDWPQMARLTSIDGTLYSSLHSDTHITRLDPVSGQGRDIELEGFDTWFAGISSDASGVIRVLDDGRSGAGEIDGWVRLWSFDVQTGLQTSDPIVTSLHTQLDAVLGLHCEPAP